MPVSAPPEHLLLIPGLLLDADLWRAQVADLGGRVTCSVPAAHHAADTLPAMAAAILAGAPDRFALAGMSMGGVVAQEIMVQAPGRVSHLALLNTTSRADTPKQREHRDRLLRQSQHGRFTGISRHAFHQWVHPDHAHDAALYERIAAMTRSVGREVFVRQQTAMLDRPDYRAGLSAIRCPALVVGGEDDTVTPPDLARETAAAIPGARLLILPRCGHLSPVERPGEVTAALAGLLGLE
jgi:pimeloyl-ACP methyl ester carboxylesterase